MKPITLHSRDSLFEPFVLFCAYVNPFLTSVSRECPDLMRVGRCVFSG